jgi:hypothetical protein
MKKSLFFVGLLLLTIPAMSQGKKYEKAMEAVMEKMNADPGAADAADIAASFEEIAKDYPDQWLPSYHASLSLIRRSFDQTDSDKRDLMIERAGKSLDHARSLAPDEAEVEALRAFYYIGLISIDPDTRGPIYYMDAMDIIERALQLDPDNPRAHYINAMWTLNMPDFMGGGPEAARPAFLKAQQKFAEYENEQPFWPDWGEELVQYELDRMEE